MTKVKDAFCDCVNVPKNCHIQSTFKTSELNNIQFCSLHSLLQPTAFHCSLIITEVPVKQFKLPNHFSAFSCARLHYSTRKHNRTILKYVINYTKHNPYLQADSFSDSQEIPVTLWTEQFITLFTTNHHLSLSSATKSKSCS